jgi:ketosteroid isomerase-like protein
MKHLTKPIFFVILLPFVASLPSSRAEEPRAAIRAILDEQVAAWNRGDIEGFMRGYAQSEATTFVTGDQLARGWETVLARYRRVYDSREKMGQLTFSELEIVPLCGDAALVHGRWELKRAHDTPHGRFTLIFRRLREGWRIVYDHTSAV